MGIGCDGLERRCDGVEQDRIDHRLVVERDLGDFARHREYDVEIGHWQQIGLTVSEPPFARRALALRAMPVAARVVCDASVRTVLARLDMTTKRSSSAELNRRPHAPLDATKMAVVGMAVGMTMAAKKYPLTPDRNAWSRLRSAAPPQASTDRAGSVPQRS